MEEQIHDFLKTAVPNQIKPFLNSLMSQNYDSFEEFTEILERSQPTFYCNTNWEIKTLNAECRNCRLFQNSCICIRCLLDGNHIQENHQIFINFDSNGSCDCGHSEAWDRKGFCKHHQGQNLHPEENLPIQIRENMKIIFEALKKFVITEIEMGKFNFFCEIFEYLIEVSKMGDGVLRLASFSFGDEHFIQTILTNSFEFSVEEAKTMKTFIASYLADDLFSSQFAKVIFPNLKDLFTKSFELCHVQINISKSKPFIGLSSILDQIFHVFNYLAKEESVVDFDQFYRDIMIVTFDFFRSNPTIFEAENVIFLIHFFWCNKVILEQYFRRGLTEKIKKFYINLASTFALIEGYIQPFQKLNDFDDNSSYHDYDFFYFFTSKFNYISSELAKKMPFIPEIIEIFVDFLYENDDLDHPSFLFMLHKLAISTLKNAKNPKEEFDKFIRENKKFSEFEEKIKNKQTEFGKYKNVYELIYHRACLIPINVIEQIMLRDFDLLSKSYYPKYYLDIINKYHKGYYFQLDFPFLLSLVQFMFSFTEDKNEFLRFIESKFSVFDKENSESKSKRMFCFILFVSALILDDPKFIGKKKRIIQLSFMTLLKYNPNISANILNFNCGVIDLNRAMNWYSQVKFESNWHIVLPFFPPKDILLYFIPDILRKITNNSDDINRSVLLPFPEFVNSDIIDLISVMNSTYLYAIIYDIMYETDAPVLYQYALNLFILLYKNEQAKNTNVKKEIQPIIATTFDEIVSQIPQNFIEFCNMKINYKKGGAYQSLIDLIENSGLIGLNALNLTFHKRDENEMKQIMKKKSKIKAIKAKIINTYKKKALKFDWSIAKNLATDVNVTKNDKMYIFVELLESTIPYFLEKQKHFNFPVKKVNNIWNRSRLKKCLIATTCGHFSNGDFNQKCSHCRSLINFFLPNYSASNDPSLYSEPVKIFTNLFNNGKNYLKLLKNMIIILDYRSRLKPEVLQDEMNYLLYRNLFIFVTRNLSSINYSLHTGQKSKLGKFLHDLIYTYNSKSLDFVDNFVHDYIIELQYKEIDYEFLKRVELIRIFYLNQKFETLIDIDEHFSFRILIKKYSISEDFIVPTKYTIYQNCINKKLDIDKEQLPVFRGIDLPENFLQIINEPFNVKLVAKEQNEKIICLATGEILKRNLYRRNMTIPHDLSCQPVLIGNGLRMNAVGIWRANYFTFHKSIYRNKKGDEDIGFKNGDLVFLDHECYIDLMDEFISGSCLRKKPIERYEVI